MELQNTKGEILNKSPTKLPSIHNRTQKTAEYFLEKIMVNLELCT